MLVGMVAATLGAGAALDVVRSGFPHLFQGNVELHLLACQGVVEVDDHAFGSDVLYHKVGGVPFLVGGLKDITLLRVRLRIELIPGHFMDQVIVNFAKGLRGDSLMVFCSSGDMPTMASSRGPGMSPQPRQKDSSSGSLVLG